MIFYKEAKTNIETGWVIEIGGKHIPLEAFNALWKPILFAALLVVAYDMGQAQAQEYIKFFAYFHGIPNADGTYYTCYPEQAGLTVAFHCENNTKGLNTGEFNFSSLNKGG